MEFTEEEIEVLVRLLETERKKPNRRKVYHSPEYRKKLTSAYDKLISMLVAAKDKSLSEDGRFCDRCQCQTPETELDNNDGICNECLINERNS